MKSVRGVSRNARRVLGIEVPGALGQSPAPLRSRCSRGFIHGLLALALGFGGGCSDPLDPPVATTIEISPATLVLEDVELTAHLSATVKDQHGQALPDIEVAWSSSDSLIVRVSEGGLVTGKEVGTVTVQVSADALTATAPVWVELGPRAVLHAVFRETGGEDWENGDNWMTYAPIDRWYGVSTDAQGNITRLTLDENGLVGSIPHELGSLPKLEILSLGDNELAGSIPPQLANLPDLRELVLDRNELTGLIPPQLGNLPNLVTLRLAHNELRGPVPPEFGNLPNLRELRLAENRLTGPIPPQLGNLPDLRELGLHGNELAGSIPPELGNLQNLRELDLSANELTGPLPPQFGNLDSLRTLYLSVNQLTGPLPGDLTGLPLVVFMWTDTALCAPTDTAFQEWLDAIQVNFGNGNCSSGSPPAWPPASTRPGPGAWRLPARGQDPPGIRPAMQPGWTLWGDASTS